MSLMRSVFGPTLQKAETAPPRGRNLDQMSTGPDGMQTGDYWGSMHPGTGLNGVGPMTWDMIDWYMRYPGVQAPPEIRINQLVDFCVPTESEHAQGYLVRLADRKKSMTKATKARAREIQKAVFAGAGPYATADGGMPQNVAMLARNSCYYDLGVFEPLRKGKGIVGWYVHDARYFRLARPTQRAWATGRWYPTGSDAMYVQVDGNGQGVKTFTRNELCWWVRNPRSDVRVRGYGYPEIDRLRRLADSLIEIWTYNEGGYRNGSHSANIVVVRQQLEDDMWTALQRRFYTLLTTPRNAMRTLFMNMGKDEGVDVKPMGSTHADMQFDQSLNWAFKNYIGGWAMDPIEVGVEYGQQGGGTALGGRAGPEERIEMSKERGLRPMLRSLGAILDSGLVKQMDPDFEGVFVGLGLPGDEERLEMTIKKVGSWMTVKEAREIMDLEPLRPGGAVQAMIDTCPLNPSLVQAFMLDAQQQQGQGGGDGQEPTEGEDGPPFQATMTPQLPDGSEPPPQPQNPDDVMKSLFRNPDQATRALAQWFAESGRVKPGGSASEKTWTVNLEVS